MEKLLRKNTDIMVLIVPDYKIIGQDMIKNNIIIKKDCTLGKDVLIKII